MKVNRWKKMVDRHNKEREEMLQGLANLRITQTDAARMMGMSRQHLNQLIKTHKIFWAVKAQGRKKMTENDPE
jgi:transcriptional regulator with GAF, ATPase, and Fis domain